MTAARALTLGVACVAVLGGCHPVIGSRTVPVDASTSLVLEVRGPLFIEGPCPTTLWWTRGDARTLLWRDALDEDMCGPDTVTLDVVRDPAGVAHAVQLRAMVEPKTDVALQLTLPR